MKTIAVTSGKGGVGKSSLSANVGVALAKMGYRPVIFDADLALANLEVVLGTRAEFSLQHVVAEEKGLKDVVATGPGGVGFVAGGSGVPTLMRSGPKRLAMFFEQVAGLSEDHDVVLYDTAAGLENRVLAFLKAADEVLLVVTPEPTSVTDAYATVKTLFRHKPDAVVRVVVNMAADAAEAKQVYDILSQITTDFLKKPLAFAGFVRRDAAVSDAARQRRPYVVGAPKSDAAKDTVKLAASLVESLELALAS